MEKIYILILSKYNPEAMYDQLKKSGFGRAPSTAEADLVIVYSCAARRSVLLETLLKIKKNVVIAGCAAKEYANELAEYSKITISQLSHLGEVIEETLSGNAVSLIVDDNPVVQRPLVEGIRATVPIAAGCLEECELCKRTAHHIVPEEEIKNSVSEVIKKGAREIELFAQDAVSEIDKATEAACSARILEGEFKVMLPWISPNKALPLLSKLEKIFKWKGVYRYLRLRLGSASNFTLENLKTGYLVEDFLHIVNVLRRSNPDIAIATELLGNGDENHFRSSMNFIKTLRPDELYTDDRSFQQAYEWVLLQKNQSLVGWQGNVLCTDKEGGRNDSYRRILFSGTPGSVCTVKIRRLRGYFLEGQIL